MQVERADMGFTRSVHAWTIPLSEQEANLEA